MAVSRDQSYLACFRGTDLRRTEVSSMAWVAQACCGAGLMSFSIQLYKQAGLSEESTFNFNIAQYSIGIIGMMLIHFTYVLAKHAYTNSQPRFCWILVPHGLGGPSHTLPVRLLYHVHHLALRRRLRYSTPLRCISIWRRLLAPRLYIFLQFHYRFRWVFTRVGDTFYAPQEQYCRPCPVCIQHRTSTATKFLAITGLC
jgi:hypothetical protein